MTPETVNIVRGQWFDPPGYYYGEAMAGPLCRDCHRDAGHDDDDAHPIPYDTEADTPTHCHKCDALIAHDLTRDGYEYVAEALADGAGRPDVLAAWREEWGAIIERGAY